MDVKKLCDQFIYGMTDAQENKPRKTDGADFNLQDFYDYGYDYGKEISDGEDNNPSGTSG